jgi:hypothetical protein
MDVQQSDTFEIILGKIMDREGIPPDKLVFTAEQQPEEDLTIHSTPDMFGSEEFPDRKSDSLWTPGSSCASQLERSIDNDRLFFVNFDALKLLFFKCREPGCDSPVQESDINIVIKGAGVKISALCAQNHFTRWQSTEFFNDVRFFK